jgi:hypothetical protein
MSDLFLTGACGEPGGARLRTAFRSRPCRPSWLKLAALLMFSSLQSACSTSCRLTSDCGSGSYCSAERFCTQECKEDVDCPTACACTEHGECINADSGLRCTQPPLASGPADASVPDDAGTVTEGGSR